MEGFTRFAGLILAATLAQAPLVGTWALSSGKPLAAAEMRVRDLPGNRVALDLYETTGTMHAPIRNYALDMTKLIHMVVIDTGFTQFMHVHPVFDPTSGHFSQTLQLDPARRYYIYADTEPKGIGQQVFRFTLQPGTQATMQREPRPLMTPSPRQVSAGSYTVALSTTTLVAEKAQRVAIAVTRAGRLANDLRPYLGAAGHAVFINTATLEYVHVHPTVKGAMDPDMDMGSMQMDANPQAGPQMVMSVPALAPGTYKLWLQFQGKTGLEVAPFTLVAR